MTQTMSTPGLAAQRELLTDVVSGGAFDIGGRTFVVRKLKLGPFLAVGDLVMTEVQTLAADGVLDPAVLSNLSGENIGAIIDLIIKVWRRAPEVVKQLLGLVFGVADDDAATRDFLLAEIDVEDVPRIIEAFMAVNPWQDIVANFFRIGQQITGAFNRERPTTS
jgi:hypothetical protein